jgi:dTDP-4-dehydrorhamnose 3,5-epimerase-like enzyme
MRLQDKIQIIPRKLIADERGWFMKVITGKENGLPAYTGEVYLTMGRPGQIKGGHYHPLANEWFTMIEGDSILLLEDVESKERMEVPLRFEEAQTVFIPSGVAHAFLNEGEKDFIVLAYTDQLYDPADTIAYNIKK